MARLAEMRETLVKRMLFEPGGEGLAITCKALGFARKDFSVIFLLSRRARPENARTFKTDHEAAMTFFDRIEGGQRGRLCASGSAIRTT